MLGNLAALGGSAIWLILATFLKMPISGTHSIVGAVLGFSLVARGFSGINWWTLGKIVLSWFVSPVLSGCVSAFIFCGINHFILQKSNPIKPGLYSLPFFYGATLFINVASILLDGPDFLQIKTSLPNWTEPLFGFLIALGVGLIVAFIVGAWVVPRLRGEIDDELMGNRKTGGRNSIFNIGDPPNTSTESSPEQTPINTSHNNLHKNDKIVINTYNFIPELNHNHYNKYTIEHEKEKTRSGPPSLEIIPMDGITPNSSGAPLIKQNHITDVEIGYNRTNGRINVIDTSDEGLTFSGCARSDEDDKPGVGKLFSFLQILTAAFGSFAHGGNDVSNAIGPLIALWLVYQEGVVATKAPTPIYLLIYGGIGISLGLWIWGRRVIKTMGEDLTKITPSSGFTIEIGAAITVLVASKIGLPVSTTHCKVGSVVSVGWLRSSRGGVDWTLFRNIVFAWLVTVPVSGGLSALLMWAMSSFAI
jgi:sodium-dependent phosphate transporter